ncbi:MAG TPA: hypothetical protein PJ982_17595, partial [Lacipirellulaceae bacterium]|nr:hypothetical protein [Lacipirellulaceae bacterium]
MDLTVSNGSGLSIANGGALHVHGLSSVIGTLNWDEASVVSYGELSLMGTTNLYASGPRTLTGIVDNRGTFNFVSGQLALQQAGATATQLRNLGTVSLSGTGTNFSFGSGAPTIVNEPGGLITRTASGTATIAVPMTNRGRIVSNTGTLAFTGGLTNTPSATIGGNGTIAASFTNSGRVAPGNSPGILTIQGNYTQSLSGELEIEVGGLTAGTQHDRLDVVADPNLPGSGVATLAGRLNVPLIGGFVPNVGDQITFLTAEGGIAGDFNALFMPNPSGRAIELVKSPTSWDMRFVNETAASQAAALAANNEWSSAATWSSAVPVTTDAVNLTNATATDIRVEVAAADAFTHQLTVSGGASTMTVAVNAGRFLSSTAGVAIEEQGIVELAGGTLSSYQVQVESGGALRGTGTLYGNLTNGADAEAAPGAVEVGLGLGQLRVDGQFQQSGSGQLLIDVAGGGQSDLIDVGGAALLGGTLSVHVPNDNSVQAGQVVGKGGA